MLRSVNQLDLLQMRRVSVLGWRDLCEKYGVASVNVVQLDCEGKDAAILRGMVEFCEHRPAAWPRVIKFEANHLTPKEEVAAAVEALRRNDYWVREWSSENVVVERIAEAQKQFRL